MEIQIHYHENREARKKKMESFAFSRFRAFVIDFPVLGFHLSVCPVKCLYPVDPRILGIRSMPEVKICRADLI
jgi:hypothetical protein